VKLKPAQIDAFLQRPGATYRVAVIYGPDLGLVRERGQQLCQSFLAEPLDSFNSIELSEKQLQDDGALFVDEMAALSFTGGKRVVRVRDAGEPTGKAVQAFLDAPVGESLAVIEARDLSPRSKLRKLAESHKQAVAIPCYAVEGANLGRVVRDMLTAAGKAAEPDALHTLTAFLGADRALIRAEVDKLVSYLGDEPRLQVAHVLACIGDTSEQNIEDLVYAVFGGDLPGARRHFDKVRAEGGNTVQILRTMTRHAQKLMVVQYQLAAKEPLDQVLKNLRPPIFFKKQTAFKQQVAVWPLADLTKAMAALLDAEISCKTTAYPDWSILDRMCIQFGRVALKNSKSMRRF
jgi:DNA polymerase-3 subunit delta